MAWSGLALSKKWKAEKGFRQSSSGFRLYAVLQTNVWRCVTGLMGLPITLPNTKHVLFAVGASILSSSLCMRYGNLNSLEMETRSRQSLYALGLRIRLHGRFQNRLFILSAMESSSRLEKQMTQRSVSEAYRQETQSRADCCGRYRQRVQAQLSKSREDCTRCIASTE